MFEGRASFGEHRGTASEHYKRFAKAGVPGYVLEDDGARELPEELDHLMIWFSDIRARASRGQHFEPILLGEIQAYEHFLAKVGIQMTAFDWDMIFRLDAIWMDCVPKSDSKTPPKATRH